MSKNNIELKVCEAWDVFSLFAHQSGCNYRETGD